MVAADARETHFRGIGRQRDVEHLRRCQWKKTQDRSAPGVPAVPSRAIQGQVASLAQASVRILSVSTGSAEAAHNGVTRPVLVEYEDTAQSIAAAQVGGSIH